MSSWAQQREAIRRAAQGGVRARTNAQGSQRLPLANNRLREVLLSRPNGELTRAGQFYYGLLGGRPPSRQFDEQQPLIREGPTDYILLRSGLKKPVRSLQPDGSYRLTKLGKSFFRDKYTEWLAHVPVRITGTRQRGRNAGRAYMREDFLPVTVVNGSLSRQSSGLSDAQAHARETYRYDANRDWAFSNQTLQAIDNRAQTEVALRQPMGALQEISYQLYNGSEILPSAFEARGVLSDFDAICDKGWEERGTTALERGAPMFFVSCGGQLIDAHQPPVKENKAVAFTCYQGHAYFYKSARAVSLHGAALLRVAALGWPHRDLRKVRATLLAQGHQPKVTMRSLCDWRALRLRVRDAPDCVVTQYPEYAEILRAWMQQLGLEYRGQRLAGAATEAFQHLLKARRLDARGSRDHILEEQNHLCKLCSAPIELGLCEFDHVVPVHRPWRARSKCCRPCAWSATAPSLRAEPAPAAAGLQAGEARPRAGLLGRGRVRCRKNALANATFPLPVFSPLDSVEHAREGHLADLTYVDLHCDDRQALLRKLPYLGRGWYSKPAAAYLLETNQATWSDFKWSLDATAHVEPRCLAQALEKMEDAWPEGEEHMAKLSVNALIGLWVRNQDLVYSMRTSNHELDATGCQWRQTFTDAAGKVHWDHIYATELFSNYTLRPLHDYVMAQEHVAVAKIRRPAQKVPLTARKHPDGTPVYRFEECKSLEGQYREPRIEAPYLDWPPGWQRVEDPLLHCLNGKSLLLSGMPGTDKTHLARQIVAQLCELGEVVKLVSKTHCSVQNLGAGAQTADRFVRRSIRNGSCELDRLVIEEITQLDSSLWADIAELSLNPKVKFLLLGDFQQLPTVLDALGGAPVTKPLKRSRLLHDLAGGFYHELTENHRSDGAIFGFLQYLRVDEAEEPPLHEALQLARERFPRRGQPDTCLVISHANRMRLNEQHNRRMAPEGAVTLRYENSPQTMRVWPGLRLVGAGGKVAKGCFVTVSEASPESVKLETGERFTHAELLRHTRLCHAITYASCQGLTLPALRAAPPRGPRALSWRSVTIKIPQLGGMSQHWRSSTLSLQLRPARSPGSGSGWPLVSQMRTRSQFSLNLTKLLPRELVFQAGLHAGLHFVGHQALAEDLGVAEGLLREQLHHLPLDLLELRHRGLLGLEADGHALGLGVVEGGGLPDDLLNFGGLPHWRAAALAAQGHTLAALGVGQKLSQLDRHGWRGLLR
ncbi:unnamed protein product [Symbiodinium natans]|uniref:Uncharacterized protein n=1 Tax=Symbiodinium natans TaxID=878477 RepID=A0A812K620_9DINO|nr:unnamed protein product [Symbiodinium natans]